MRLFTGIDLPEDVLARIAALLERLQPTAKARWSPPANLHITTKFIGEWPEERLAEMNEALRRLPDYSRIPIAIQKLVFFPNERSPRIFFAGVSAGPALEQLARDTDSAVASLGVA